ncbi:winged helix-turn-helix domain-containing protein, partial [bacterium]|nr:winged helix-turn-helix domain-containing protein [bacterium]
MKFDDLMNPVIQALKILGGSGTIEEINNKVAEVAKIPSDQLEVLHNPEKGGMTEIEYRLMWTRTYLKRYEIIDNSSRGVWSLTE